LFKRILKKISITFSANRNLEEKQGLLNFRSQFDHYKTLAKRDSSRFLIQWEDRWPCLHDNTKKTEFDRHYIYHPAWASRILAKIRPSEHIDIGSSLSFVAMLSAFIPVRFYDYRPSILNLHGLDSEYGDLLALPFADDSISSLSCMHVIEHIGLGRYGEPMDPEGDLKAIDELKRVTAKGGNLLFVVPIGQPKIQFNAHRIYSHEMILNYFWNFELVQFAIVPDDPEDGGLIIDASKNFSDSQKYGCGCFWFQKK